MNNYSEFTDEYVLKLQEEIEEYIKEIDKIEKYIRYNFCNNDDINDCWHEGFKVILDIIKGE